MLKQEKIDLLVSDFRKLDEKQKEIIRELARKLVKATEKKEKGKEKNEN